MFGCLSDSTTGKALVSTFVLIFKNDIDELISKCFSRENQQIADGKNFVTVSLFYI